MNVPLDSFLRHPSNQHLRRSRIGPVSFTPEQWAVVEQLAARATVYSWHGEGSDEGGSGRAG